MRRGLYRHEQEWGRNSVLLDHPFTSIADPRGLASPGGLGGVFGVPDFLWVAGDGDAPTIGPALTVTGTPTVGDTPWQLDDGSAVVSEVYNGTPSRVSTAALNPSTTDDVIIYALARTHGYVGLNARLLSTRDITNGWMIYRNTATTWMAYFRSSGGLVTQGLGPNPLGSYSMIVAIVDRDADMTLFLNNVSSGGVAVIPGPCIGDGIGICRGPLGGVRLSADVIFVGARYGSGIANAWLADSAAMVADFTHRFTGIHPHQGDRGAFTRNSAAGWQNRNGVWAIASPGLPRAGDSLGLRAAPARTNKVYNTVSPQVTTGWSIAGGTHTVVDDSTALENAGLQAFGPNVHRHLAGGACQCISGGAATGNTNEHSLRVWMRGASGGENVDLGFHDVSLGAHIPTSAVVLTTGYQLFAVKGATPSDVDLLFSILNDPGQTIYFIAPQMEEGDTPTSPIPNWATAATATRAAEVLTTSHTPSDIQGSVEAYVTPLGFSATDIVGSPVVLDRAGSATLLMYMHAAGWRAGDGTATVTSGTPTDGAEDRLRVRWSGSGLSIDVDGVFDSGAYDGALTGAGVLTIEPGEEVALRNFRAFKKGTG